MTFSTADQPATIETSSSAVNWGPIVAGAFAAATLTVILMLVGSGLGLAMMPPWGSPSLTTFAVSTAVWLVIVQWLSSALGGYVAGRLRTKWVNVHTDEVYFRDTAHGFLAWALATLLVATVLGSAVSGIAGTGAQATTGLLSGAAAGAASQASSARTPSANDLAGYFVDALFRPAGNAAAPAPAATTPQNNADTVAQAARILTISAANGEMSPEDKAYLAQLVASRTGLPQAEAQKRVDQVLAQVEDAKNKAKAAADKARKASATAALVGALSLVIGAFIAAVAGVLGGRQRDEDEAGYLRSN
ncbi:hypothetical protein EN828_09555 [Mesorhizobium sp. M2D.F.Ca.ET.185.01.1.1]|uniref:hypothetical protein n=1 Tax=unclassified Mesorhizobium TaxID=325217 RepID=UPI000FCBE7AF|nr:MULTISPECIES: hypothetical protein [unclassified Mesorhizobium]TGP55664.1 hypothetical protein EN873_09810 [bacterium M00.F.Ca.ET.230.01.1.1]TGP82819.1 hypothetical protein EN870_06150 [bacterium M00.F.Ca.ET.227.01.1.1]TGP94561.1 hypothetical protein EN864_14070 [bacterium M00.F.Ca.ET.221.01.1.1]TGP98015.1 hypothetical protein EN865_10295 [bacterium M00.F.Ca.ET.222.01.1.1]TGU02119.1 hypothetical protein EN806_45435 [bacterium M00.F.Ca.ET.163.01.1.1]TGU19550.1 hypothetical protein EN799_579